MQKGGKELYRQNVKKQGFSTMEIRVCTLAY